MLPAASNARLRTNSAKVNAAAPANKVNRNGTEVISSPSKRWFVRKGARNLSAFYHIRGMVSNGRAVLHGGRSRYVVPLLIYQQFDFTESRRIQIRTGPLVGRSIPARLRHCHNAELLWDCPHLVAASASGLIAVRRPDQYGGVVPGRGSSIYQALRAACFRSAFLADGMELDDVLRQSHQFRHKGKREAPEVLIQTGHDDLNPLIREPLAERHNALIQKLDLFNSDHFYAGQKRRFDFGRVRDYQRVEKRSVMGPNSSPAAPRVD